MNRSRWVWVALLALAAPPLSAQTVTADGLLMAVWGDPASPADKPTLHWTHRDDSGVERPVVITPAVLEAAGGYFSVNGRRLRMTAIRRSGAAGRSDAPQWEARSLSSPQGRTSSAAGPEAAPQLGSKPYAVLLCKFPDVEGEPISAAALAAVHISVYPGMDHYWREVSANQMNVGGTQVLGWFTLPKPKAAYISGSTPVFQLLAADCAGAADAQVNFASFAGIQTQYNSNLTVDGTLGSSYGGATFLTLDGVSRAWPFTWMAHWATSISRYGVYAHEIGHSLGLPHSSGPYSETYDSNWDVMSNPYLQQAGSLSLPGHTILPHKHALGWIPESRRRTVTFEQTLTLDQAEFPPPGSNPLMVEVAIPGTSARYVLEARRLLGYDERLPGEAVIIHRVTGACDSFSVVCARVVDPDGNGNPNDAGAMWRAGEVFNGEGGVQVAINARTEHGWNITVSPGGIAPQCALTLTQTAGGTIALTSGILSGVCGRSVTVSATAAAGHVFRGWSTGVANTPYTFTVGQNMALSANFIRQCSLSLEQSSGGTISLTGGTLAGDCGRAVAVTAMPNPGAVFIGWSDAGSANPRTLIVSDVAQTLGAAFTDINGLASRTVSALLTASTGGLLVAERQYLDERGNGNGSLDLGDLLALLDRHPGVQMNVGTLRELYVQQAPVRTRRMPDSSDEKRTGHSKERIR